MHCNTGQTQKARVHASEENPAQAERRLNVLWRNAAAGWIVEASQKPHPSCTPYRGKGNRSPEARQVCGHVGLASSTQSSSSSVCRVGLVSQSLESSWRWQVMRAPLSHSVGRILVKTFFLVRPEIVDPRCDSFLAKSEQINA